MLKNKTTKDIAVYSFGNILSKVLGFILLPYQTRYLTTAIVGVFGLITPISVILTAVFGLNLSSALLRWYSADPKQGRIFTSTVFLFLLLIAAFINIFSFLFKPIFGFFIGSDYTGYTRLIILLITSEMFYLFCLNLLRSKGRSLYYVVVNAVKLTVSMVSTILMLVVFKAGLTGVILGQIFGNGLFLILTLPIILKELSFKIDTDLLKSMLKYSVPLVLTTISTNLLTQADRYILKFLADETSVGIYYVGHKVASVLNVVLVVSIQTALLPIAIARFESKKANDYLPKVQVNTTILLAAGFVFLSLFAREVLMIAAKGKDYAEVYLFVPVLMATFLFKHLQNIFSMAFYYYKKISVLTAIVFVGVGVNIALNYLLIPKFNVIGASIATAMSTVVTAGIMYFLTQKQHHMNFQNAKVLGIIILALAFASPAYFTHSLSFLNAFLLKLAAGIIFLGFSYFILSKDDRHSLLNTLRIRTYKDNEKDSTK